MQISTNNDTESILNSVKKMLGLAVDYNPFDSDIIMHINSVFANLAQMGVSPNDEGFSITDSSTKWSEFTEDNALLANVKSYMYLKVRLLFDPPSSSYVLESFNRQISEFEWRMYVQKGGYR